MGEIKQLVDAHGALVRYRKAEAVIKKGSNDLRDISKVIDALTQDPGQGKPPEAQELNSAAIALLSAHLQGYITELYEEATAALLTGHVPDVKAVTKTAPTRGNPNEENIKKLFGTIGFENFLLGISWKKMSNESLRTKLREFNELRNKIVHGKSETVTKAQVQNYLVVWTSLAKHLDNKVQDEIKKASGKAPWKRA